ncbi:MAG: hypothetical protein M3Q65_01170 [Chloroflexota bacterium]|nr:hypothetical protein [Chloroflexota bacterium]
MANSTGQPLDVIYGRLWDDELVLLPLDTARYLATLREALTEAKTWGEFKARAPEGAYAEVVEMIADNADGDEEFTEPAADTPFDPEDIPGYADGDWPLLPPQHMFDWLPEDLQQRYGHTGDTVLNGPYLAIDPAHTRELVAEMEARGYHCTEDSDLLQRATGF